MVDFLRANFHAPGFDVNNPKFEYVDKDPKEYLKRCQDDFDIIITDCTAPSRKFDTERQTTIINFYDNNSDAKCVKLHILNDNLSIDYFFTL